MKRIINLILFCCLIVNLSLYADIPTGYYSAADNKQGASALLNALHNCIDGHTTLSYGSLGDYYDDTDLKDGKIWDMYSTCNFTISDAGSSQKKVCDCWNKEHSVPQSWFNEASPMKSDLFHVYPTDARVNNFRGNMPYGETSNRSYIDSDSKALGYIGASNFSGYTGKVYEPIDEYKGDFARTYFYMVARYIDKNFNQSANGTVVFTYSSGKTNLTSYAVKLFMKWHRQDPVSQKEIDRNNAVYKHQKNRNPFIDYPYLAEYIWGTKTNETMRFANLVSSSDSKFIPGKSDGWLGDSAPVETYTVKWLVSGEEYMTGDPTVQLNKGGVITKLPSAPKSCDEVSTQFVGWSEEPIIGTTDEQPIDLFTTADDAPDIMQNTEFHAVFAKLTEVVTYSSHAPAAESTVSMSLTDQAGWTLSGLTKDTKHWRMVTGSYIESPSVDASQITSITINMRTYGGNTYKTIDFSINNKEFGELNATTNSLKEYTWTPPSTLSGTGKIRFSSTTNSAENGPALSEIAIQLSGVSSGDNGSGEDSGNTSGDTGGEVSYVYTRYMTTCQGTSTEHVELTPLVKEANKMLKDGQLLIEYNGVYYNIFGMQL